MRFRRKTYSWLLSAAVMAFVLSFSPQSQAGEIREATLAGYLIIPNERVDPSYNGGFSMYVAAWPLQEQYPGHRFQSGLVGTWMFAQYEKPPTRKLYSDIEGGLGWWRDTRFPTITPKFIMGGVALNFSAWANGPGAGKGRDWSRPLGKYGVAQLSPWLLWPPDGLNLKQGACGELFGYGYLPLPLTRPKSKTAGKNVPTGNHCWTLFLNTANFKGPVAFFLPYFWSKPALRDPTLAGMFLDSRFANPNRALQMETQYIPAVIASDSKGETYARIAPTDFPTGPDGIGVLVHEVISYSKDALWNPAKKWFQGGPPVDRINIRAARVHTFPGNGWATWRIYTPGTPNEERAPVDWSSFATPVAPDPATFGFKWNQQFVTTRKYGSCQLVRLPEFYHLVKKGKKPKWVPIPPDQVPPETGLTKYKFRPPVEPPPEAYVTPEEPDSCWKKPGPVAGPFQVRLGDGSLVTYYWYRFADQPALLNADLTDKEREELQARVEMLHRLWRKDKNYLPPPKTGRLASIDPALIVTPPPGLEVGYVPIVTRQEPAR